MRLLMTDRMHADCASSCVSGRASVSALSGCQPATPDRSLADALGDWSEGVKDSESFDNDMRLRLDDERAYVKALMVRASFSAEISVRSPRTLFIFIIYNNLFWIQVSKKYFISFRERKHCCWYV